MTYLAFDILKSSGNLADTFIQSNLQVKNTHTHQEQPGLQCQVSIVSKKKLDE